LAHVSADIFPDTLDYVALGHLHVPQKVGGSDTIRYSGSPLPMGFGEAGQKKSLCVVEFSGRDLDVRLLSVPVFQKLERISGNWEEISARIFELKAMGSRAWLEIVYEGKEIMGDLRERLDAIVAGTDMEILRVKNSRIVERVMRRMHQEETLDDLDVDDVFERCLDAHEVPQEQRAELIGAYRETLISLDEQDSRAQ
jgi:exonuclease SbcD